jgi:hypothetical protein
VRELSEVPEKGPDYLPAIAMDRTELEKYVGVYENEDGGEIIITLEGTSLIFQRPNNRSDEIIPHSKEKFSLRFTAIDLDFKLDESGVPVEMSLTFTGVTQKFKKSE